MRAYNECQLLLSFMLCSVMICLCFSKSDVGMFEIILICFFFLELVFAVCFLLIPGEYAYDGKLL